MLVQSIYLVSTHQEAQDLGGFTIGIRRAMARRHFGSSYQFQHLFAASTCTYQCNVPSENASILEVPFYFIPWRSQRAQVQRCYTFANSAECLTVA